MRESLPLLETNEKLHPSFWLCIKQRSMNTNARGIPPSQSEFNVASVDLAVWKKESHEETHVRVSPSQRELKHASVGHGKP